jgi:hypothetical protein
MKFLKVCNVEFKQNLLQDLWDTCKSPFMTLWKLGSVRINLAQNRNFPTTFDKSLAYRISTKYVELVMGNMEPPRHM